MRFLQQHYKHNSWFNEWSATTARDGVLSIQEGGKPLEPGALRPQLTTKRHTHFSRCWAPPSLVSHLWTPQSQNSPFLSRKWGLLQGAVPATGRLGADGSLGSPVVPGQRLPRCSPPPSAPLSRHGQARPSWLSRACLRTALTPTVSPQLPGGVEHARGC